MCVSIYNCYTTIVHRDKRLVEQILQSGAIKSLQKKKAAWDGVIQGAPVK